MEGESLAPARCVIETTAASNVTAVLIGGEVVW
jgi:hypothetical protein